MYTLAILIGIVGFFITFFILSSAILDSKQRKNMKLVEKRLKESGVTPQGSTLCHGMYIDCDGTLKADQKKSIMWYKRLV